MGECKRWRGSVAGSYPHIFGESATKKANAPAVGSQLKLLFVEVRT